MQSTRKSVSIRQFCETNDSVAAIEISPALKTFLQSDPICGRSDYSGLPGVDGTVHSSWRTFASYPRREGIARPRSATSIQVRQRRLEAAQRQSEKRQRQRERQKVIQRERRRQKDIMERLQNSGFPSPEEGGQSSILSDSNIIISSPQSKSPARNRSGEGKSLKKSVPRFMNMTSRVVRNLTLKFDRVTEEDGVDSDEKKKKSNVNLSEEEKSRVLAHIDETLASVIEASVLYSERETAITELSTNSDPAQYNWLENNFEDDEEYGLPDTYDDFEEVSSSAHNDSLSEDKTENPSSSGDSEIKSKPVIADADSSTSATSQRPRRNVKKINYAEMVDQWYDEDPAPPTKKVKPSEKEPDEEKQGSVQTDGFDGTPSIAEKKQQLAAKDVNEVSSSVGEMEDTGDLLHNSFGNKPTGQPTLIDSIDSLKQTTNVLEATHFPNFLIDMNEIQSNRTGERKTATIPSSPSIPAAYSNPNRHSSILQKIPESSPPMLSPPYTTTANINTSPYGAMPSLITAWACSSPSAQPGQSPNLTVVSPDIAKGVFPQPAPAHCNSSPAVYKQLIRHSPQCPLAADQQVPNSLVKLLTQPSRATTLIQPPPAHTGAHSAHILSGVEHLSPFEINTGQSLLKSQPTESRQIGRKDNQLLSNSQSEKFNSNVVTVNFISGGNGEINRSQTSRNSHAQNSSSQKEATIRKGQISLLKMNPGPRLQQFLRSENQQQLPPPLPLNPNQGTETIRQRTPSNTAASRHRLSTDPPIITTLYRSGNKPNYGNQQDLHGNRSQPEDTHSAYSPISPPLNESHFTSSIQPYPGSLALYTSDSDASAIGPYSGQSQNIVSAIGLYSIQSQSGASAIGLYSSPSQNSGSAIGLYSSPSQNSGSAIGPYSSQPQNNTSDIGLYGCQSQNRGSAIGSHSGQSQSSGSAVGQTFQYNSQSPAETSRIISVIGSVFTQVHQEQSAFENLPQHKEQSGTHSPQERRMSQSHNFSVSQKLDVPTSQTSISDQLRRPGSSDPQCRSQASPLGHQIAPGQWVPNGPQGPRMANLESFGLNPSPTSSHLQFPTPGQFPRSHMLLPNRPVRSPQPRPGQQSSNNKHAASPALATKGVPQTSSSQSTNLTVSSNSSANQTAAEAGNSLGLTKRKFSDMVPDQPLTAEKSRPVISSTSESFHRSVPHQTESEKKMESHMRIKKEIYEASLQAKNSKSQPQSVGCLPTQVMTTVTPTLQSKFGPGLAKIKQERAATQDMETDEESDAGMSASKCTPLHTTQHQTPPRHSGIPGQSQTGPSPHQSRLKDLLGTTLHTIHQKTGTSNLPSAVSSSHSATTSSTQSTSLTTGQSGINTLSTLLQTASRVTLSSNLPNHIAQALNSVVAKGWKINVVTLPSKVTDSQQNSPAVPSQSLSQAKLADHSQHGSSATDALHTVTTSVARMSQPSVILARACGQSFSGQLCDTQPIMSTSTITSMSQSSGKTHDHHTLTGTLETVGEVSQKTGLSQSNLKTMVPQSQRSIVVSLSGEMAQSNPRSLPTSAVHGMRYREEIIRIKKEKHSGQEEEHGQHVEEEEENWGQLEQTSESGRKAHIPPSAVCGIHLREEMIRIKKEKHYEHEEDSDRDHDAEEENSSQAEQPNDSNRRASIPPSAAYGIRVREEMIRIKKEKHSGIEGEENETDINDSLSSSELTESGNNHDESSEPFTQDTDGVNKDSSIPTSAQYGIRIGEQMIQIKKERYEEGYEQRDENDISESVSNQLVTEASDNADSSSVEDANRQVKHSSQEHRREAGTCEVSRREEKRINIPAPALFGMRVREEMIRRLKGEMPNIKQEQNTEDEGREEEEEDMEAETDLPESGPNQSNVSCSFPESVQAVLGNLEPVNPLPENAQIENQTETVGLVTNSLLHPEAVQSALTACATVSSSIENPKTSTLVTESRESVEHFLSANPASIDPLSQSSGTNTGFSVSIASSLAISHSTNSSTLSTSQAIIKPDPDQSESNLPTNVTKLQSTMSSASFLALKRCLSRFLAKRASAMAEKWGKTPSSSSSTSTQISTEMQNQELQDQKRSKAANKEKLQQGGSGDKQEESSLHSSQAAYEKANSLEDSNIEAVGTSAELKNSQRNISTIDQCSQRESHVQSQSGKERRSSWDQLMSLDAPAGRDLQELTPHTTSASTRSSSPNLFSILSELGSETAAPQTVVSQTVALSSTVSSDVSLIMSALPSVAPVMLNVSEETKLTLPNTTSAIPSMSPNQVFLASPAMPSQVPQTSSAKPEEIPRTVSLTSASEKVTIMLPRPHTVSTMSKTMSEKSIEKSTVASQPTNMSEELSVPTPLSMSSSVLCTMSMIPNSDHLAAVSYSLPTPAESSSLSESTSVKSDMQTVTFDSDMPSGTIVSDMPSVSLVNKMSSMINESDMLSLTANNNMPSLSTVSDLPSLTSDMPSLSSDMPSLTTVSDLSSVASDPDMPLMIMDNDMPPVTMDNDMSSVTSDSNMPSVTGLMSVTDTTGNSESSVQPFTTESQSAMPSAVAECLVKSELKTPTVSSQSTISSSLTESQSMPLTSLPTIPSFTVTWSLPQTSLEVKPPIAPDGTTLEKPLTSQLPASSSAVSRPTSEKIEVKVENATNETSEVPSSLSPISPIITSTTAGTGGYTVVVKTETLKSSSSVSDIKPMVEQKMETDSSVIDSIKSSSQGSYSVTVSLPPTTTSVAAVLKEECIAPKNLIPTVVTELLSKASSRKKKYAVPLTVVTESLPNTSKNMEEDLVISVQIPTTSHSIATESTNLLTVNSSIDSNAGVLSPLLSLCQAADAVENNQTPLVLDPNADTELVVSTASPLPGLSPWMVEDNPMLQSILGNSSSNLYTVMVTSAQNSAGQAVILPSSESPIVKIEPTAATLNLRQEIISIESDDERDDNEPPVLDPVAQSTVIKDEEPLSFSISNSSEVIDISDSDSEPDQAADTDNKTVIEIFPQGNTNNEVILLDDDLPTDDTTTGSNDDGVVMLNESTTATCIIPSDRVNSSLITLATTAISNNSNIPRPNQPAVEVIDDDEDDQREVEEIVEDDDDDDVEEVDVKCVLASQRAQPVLNVRSSMMKKQVEYIQERLSRISSDLAAINPDQPLPAFITAAAANTHSSSRNNVSNSDNTEANISDGNERRTSCSKSIGASTSSSDNSNSGPPRNSITISIGAGSSSSSLGRCSTSSSNVSIAGTGLPPTPSPAPSSSPLPPSPSSQRARRPSSSSEQITPQRSSLTSSSPLPSPSSSSTSSLSPSGFSSKLHSTGERPEMVKGVLLSIAKWTREDVAAWLRRNKLANICPNLSNLDGLGLQRMAFEYQRDPDFFYTRVKKTLGLTMFQTMVISRSLQELIKGQTE